MRLRRDGAVRPQGTVARIHSELERLTGVAVPLRLWDGTELGGPGTFRLVLAHPWSARALLAPPRGARMSDAAAGAAYTTGAIDIEGDMVAAIATGSAVARSVQALPRHRLLPLARAVRRLPAPPAPPSPGRPALSGRRHSQARDRQAIAHHYDLPQAFYETFLDQGLVYSCAYFADPDEPLEVAQTRKLELICRKLRLRPGMRLLDIGCGWGSLLLHAARHHGVEGIGVTLSETQHAAATERARVAGLGQRVHVELRDYREVTGQFDAVASVGMFEHVGPDHLPEYFAAAYRLTAPGGLFLNHGIVTGDAQRIRTGDERDFTSAAVFPDGGLVPAWRAVQAMQEPGFELLDLEQLRPHYGLTLRRWVAGLEAHRTAAVATASEQAYRTWRAYMAGAAHGFETGHLGVVQVLGLRGPRPRDLPLDRSWMLLSAPRRGDPVATPARPRS
jgi:cyclopropane-fatty-acyl-phospholipid synthase